MVPIWTRAVEKYLPHMSISDCGSTDRIFVEGTVAQCRMWLDDRDIGYVTATLDGEMLCGYRRDDQGQDWQMDVSTGNIVQNPNDLPCPPPIWWELAE